MLFHTVDNFLSPQCPVLLSRASFKLSPRNSVGRTSEAVYEGNSMVFASCSTSANFQISLFFLRELIFFSILGASLKLAAFDVQSLMLIGQHAC